MPTTLSSVDQIEFDAMVKHAYESVGWLLRDKIRLRMNVEGTQLSFRKMGYVTAEQYAFQTQVNWQDPNFQPVNLTLFPFRAATLVDDMQQFLFNFDVRREESIVIGEALGRRNDQMVIDALKNSGTSNIIAAGSRGFTWDKVRQLVAYLNSLAIPVADRTVVISATAEAQLMASLQFTNNQYTDMSAIKDGTFNRKYVMGMNWIVLPDMPEGGLPKTGNIRTCFAFHKQAVGMGIGREFRTIIERVPNVDSWQILGKMFANSIAIDNRGIVAINVDESVNETSALTVTTLSA